MMYQQAIIRFYNYLTDSDAMLLNDIPQEKLLFLSCLSMEQLCKPFVVACIQEGLSIRQISIKYGISVHTVRGIGRNQYLYSPREGVQPNTE